MFPETCTFLSIYSENNGARDWGRESRPGVERPLVAKGGTRCTYVQWERKLCWEKVLKGKCEVKGRTDEEKQQNKVLLRERISLREHKARTKMRSVLSELARKKKRRRKRKRYKLQ